MLVIFSIEWNSNLQRRLSSLEAIDARQETTLRNTLFIEAARKVVYSVASVSATYFYRARFLTGIYVLQIEAIFEYLDRCTRLPIAESKASGRIKWSGWRIAVARRSFERHENRQISKAVRITKAFSIIKEPPPAQLCRQKVRTNALRISSVLFSDVAAPLLRVASCLYASRRDSSLSFNRPEKVAF